MGTQEFFRGILPPEFLCLSGFGCGFAALCSLRLCGEKAVEINRGDAKSAEIHGEEREKSGAARGVQHATRAGLELGL
jgi:hypothetical protein